MGDHMRNLHDAGLDGERPAEAEASRRHPPPHDDARKGQHLELPLAPTPSGRWLGFLALLVVAAFGGLFLVGWLPRVRHRAALDALASPHAPGIPVAHPRVLTGVSELRLPATLVASNDTILYARIDGYVRKRYVDIGDSVKAGQLLAEIDAPDAVQQLAQAHAQQRQISAELGQTKAKAELDKSNANRAKELAKSGLVSQQDLDTSLATQRVSEAGVHSAEAAVGTSEANVRRLTDLLAFAKVVAPFDGVISGRSINVGSLVTSGNGASQQLFRITQSDPLRVTVSVPQSFAGAVKVGTQATVTVAERRGRTFAGTVTRSSGTIEMATRTMTVEVEIPNADHVLLPGTYGEIVLSAARLDPQLTIPVTALSFTAAGTQVGVVGEDGVVRMVKVTIADDFGTELSIASGLRDTDAVVVHPDDRSAAGMIVTPVFASASPGAAPSAAPVAR
jgi:RND family efflux transporter MFP subunit